MAVDVNSRRNAFCVLPVPETDWKRTKAGTVRT